MYELKERAIILFEITRSGEIMSTSDRGTLHDVIVTKSWPGVDLDENDLIVFREYLK